MIWGHCGVNQGQFGVIWGDWGCSGVILKRSQVTCNWCKFQHFFTVSIYLVKVLALIWCVHLFGVGFSTI